VKRLMSALLVSAWTLAFLPSAAHAEYRGGAYGELRQLESSKNLTVVAMICIQILAQDRAEDLGRPLSQAEFEAVRDDVPAIQMDPADAEALYARRGCRDPLTFEDYLRAR
jgi:hypothetical protein